MHKRKSKPTFLHSIILCIFCPVLFIDIFSLRDYDVIKKLSEQKILAAMDGLGVSLISKQNYVYQRRIGL